MSAICAVIARDGSATDPSELQPLLAAARHRGSHVQLRGAGTAAALGAQMLINADHGELNEVGGGALEWGVDGGAFGEAAGVRILAAHVRDGPAAAEEGLGEAGFADLGNGLVDVALHAGVALEITLDVEVGFAARNSQGKSEAEIGLAVDEAESPGLGNSAQLRVSH